MGRTPHWRFAALAGVPCLLLLAALGTGALEVAEGALRRPAFAPPLAGAGLLAAGLLVALVAGMVAARSPLVHFVGYALHSLGLATGAGYAIVRAVFNHEGGLAGEPPGPGWLTWAFGAGAALCLLCVIALLAQVVAELRPLAAGGRP